MPRTITLFDVLIACPSDVLEFIPHIDEAVSFYNHNIGRTQDNMVFLRRFGTDSYAQHGTSPQQMVNDQFADATDFVIGVFWTKFGSKTNEYASGTEEEIERKIAENKQVILYFLSDPIDPRMIDYEELQKINLFKKKHKNDCLFREILSAQLYAYAVKDIIYACNQLSPNENNLFKQFTIMNAL